MLGLTHQIIHVNFSATRIGRILCRVDFYAHSLDDQVQVLIAHWGRNYRKPTIALSNESRQ